MTRVELNKRLAAYPTICQTWVDAELLNGDGGVLYLSNITNDEEIIGVAHIYIWNRSAMGQPDGVRQAARNLMQHNGLDRIIVEIEVKNRLAINLAKMVGFNEIGTIRQRKNGRGGFGDVALMDALSGDLNG